MGSEMEGGSERQTARTRKRLNSQSQVVLIPKVSINIANRKRIQVQYYVTLLPLNDTFLKKQLLIATFPETTKLGRPTGTKHKPDVNNGYFDSRVLSRNHAQLYIDGDTGKLMLQDLDSSNGTYLNDQRLGNDPIELIIGDTVCLGFNVQTESTHKQIMLKIDNINIVKNSQLNIDIPQFKHLNFIEEIYNKVGKSNTRKELQEKYDDGEVSYDNALFGDINDTIDDDLLGLNPNSGIYNNSQIVNSPAFETIILTLISNLSKLKQQNSNLKSLEIFFKNYQSNLNDINRKYLELEISKNIAEFETELDLQKKKYDNLSQANHAQSQKIAALNLVVEEVTKENANLKLILSTEKSRISHASSLLESPKSELDPDHMNRDGLSELEHIYLNGLSELEHMNHNGLSEFGRIHQNGSSEHMDDNTSFTRLSDHKISITFDKNLLIQGTNRNTNSSRDGSSTSNDYRLDDKQLKEFNPNIIDENDLLNENNSDTIKENRDMINLDPEEAFSIPKQDIDIDLNELFQGLSTHDDIKSREQINMNSTRSSVSELEVLDTEDSHVDGELPLITEEVIVNGEQVIINLLPNENRRELNEGIQQGSTEVQHSFPKKSDDRFNSHEEVMQRVIIAVGAMLFGYVFKKIIG